MVNLKQLFNKISQLSKFKDQGSDSQLVLKESIKSIIKKVRRKQSKSYFY